MSDIDGIFSALLMREAIASVALSHDDDCDCVICRAATGEADAFAEVMLQVADERARQERDDA
jgi:hypothetical protein